MLLMLADIYAGQVSLRTSSGWHWRRVARSAFCASRCCGRRIPRQGIPTTPALPEGRPTRVRPGGRQAPGCTAQTVRSATASQRMATAPAWAAGAARAPAAADSPLCPLIGLAWTARMQYPCPCPPPPRRPCRASPPSQRPRCCHSMCRRHLRGSLQGRRTVPQDRVTAAPRGRAASNRRHSPPRRARAPAAAASVSAEAVVCLWARPA